MRYLSLCIILFLALNSCKKTDDSCIDPVIVHGTGLKGNWQLTEFLLDPGDGSGKFQTITSNRRIEIKAGNAWSSNGNVCSMYADDNTQSAGAFNEADQTFSVSSCAAANIKYKLEGSFLILSYSCFEPCAAKYARVL